MPRVCAWVAGAPGGRSYGELGPRLTASAIEAPIRGPNLATVFAARARHPPPVCTQIRVAHPASGDAT